MLRPLTLADGDASRVPLATLIRRDALKRLLHVLAAPGPGCLAALITRHTSAHILSLS
ncbi:hypothetical protein GCM10010461_16950 [Microbacterium aurantiacum]